MDTAYTEKAFSKDKAFTLTFVINWQNALDYVGDWNNKKEIVNVGSFSNGWWKQGLQMFDNNTTLQVGIYYWKDTTNNGVDDSTKNAIHTDISGCCTVTGSEGLDLGGGNIAFDQKTFCVDGRLVLTYTFDGSNTFTLSALTTKDTLATATITTNDGVLWDSIGAEYGYLDFPAHATENSIVNQVVAFKGVLSTDDILAISKDVIPEPTTATLSLLALAGLCARRRRK